MTPPCTPLWTLCVYLKKLNNSSNRRNKFLVFYSFFIRIQKIFLEKENKLHRHKKGLSNEKENNDISKFSLLKISFSFRLLVCFSLSLSPLLCLSVCLSVSLSMSMSLSVSLSFSLFLFLSVFLSIYIYMSMSLSVSLSFSLCLSSCFSLSLSLYVCPCLYIFVCLSLSLCLCLSSCFSLSLYIYIYIYIYICLCLSLSLSQFLGCVCWLNANTFRMKLKWNCFVQFLSERVFSLLPNPKCQLFSLQIPGEIDSLSPYLWLNAFIATKSQWTPQLVSPRNCNSMFLLYN